MANSVIKHIQVGPSGTAYDIVNQKVKVGTTTFDDNAVVSITGSNGVSVVGATGTNPTITVKGPSNYVIGGSQTTTSSADGGSNVFTFNKSDGTSATFTVKNGSKGSTGPVGPTGPTGPAPDLTKYPTLAGNNTFTGTNTFETEFQSSLYRTIIDKNGVSVGSGPSSGILVSTTYDYNRINYTNSGTTYMYYFPSANGTLALTSDIDVTAAGDNTFTGTNTFTGSNWFKGNSAIITTQNGIRIGFSNGVSPDADSSIYSIDKYGFYGQGKNQSLQTIKFPDLSTFSTATHTIPLSDTNNTFTGTNLFKGGTTQFLTSSAGLNDPKTDVGAYGILCQTGGNVGTYYKDGKITNGTNTLTLPLKTGTFALTSDIDVKSAGNNTFTGDNKFQGGTTSFMAAAGSPSYLVTTVDSDGVHCLFDGSVSTSYQDSQIQHKAFTLTLPLKSGTFALTNDIPIKTASLSGTTLSITLS